MNAPNNHPAGVFPPEHAAAVPIPTQSDQDMSEVFGPVVRPAELRSGIMASPMWSPTPIAPEDHDPSANSSRRADPTGTY